MQGGLDPWSKAVAEIASTLERKGDLSQVISRPEGVFLVRLTDLTPAVTRPFESVAAELERSEQARLRSELEQEFKRDIAAKHPARWPEP